MRELGARKKVVMVSGDAGAATPHLLAVAELAEYLAETPCENCRHTGTEHLLGRQDGEGFCCRECGCRDWKPGRRL